MQKNYPQDACVSVAAGPAAAADEDEKSSKRIGERKAMTSFTSFIDESQVVRPKRFTFAQLLRKQLHATCLVLTFTVYGCLTTVIYCCSSPRQRQDVPRDLQPSAGHPNLHPALRHLASPTDDVIDRSSAENGSNSKPEIQPESCRQVYVYTVGAFVTVVYLVYLFECWCCRLVSRVNHVDVEKAHSALDALRQSSPLVWWSAISYHYTPRCNRVATQRHEGAPRVHCQRVVTCRSTSGFDYTSSGVRDVSSKLADLDEFPVVEVTISRHFSFSSEVARRDFVEQRDEFCRANESRDDYVNFRQGFSLVTSSTSIGDIRSKLVVVGDIDAKPWYLSRRAYWALSLLTLSWPMRILVRWRIATLEYRIHKVFGHKYDHQVVITDGDGSAGLMTSHPLRRELTIADEFVDYEDEDDNDNVQLFRSSSTVTYSDGVESTSWLSSHQRHCDQLAPSYSQALLMDFLSRDNNNFKRVRSSVSFTFSRLRVPRLMGTVHKSQSLTSRPLLLPVGSNDLQCVPGRGLPLRRPTSFISNMLRSRSLPRSPPPSYDTALAMKLAPTSDQPSHRVVIQRQSDVNAAVGYSDTLPRTVTMVETCL